MKKQAILKSFLILLPVLAVGLATTWDSVMVFDAVAGTTEYYSYFDVLPVTQYQLLTPLAAILCIVSLILAAVALIAKKNSCIKASSIVALIAAAVAVIPIVTSGDVRVIPNVGVPIFMIVHYVFAYYMGRDEKLLKKEKKSSRLKSR